MFGKKPFHISSSCSLGGGVLDALIIPRTGTWDKPEHNGSAKKEKMNPKKFSSFSAIPPKKPLGTAGKAGQ
jgi:hypothetical protein